MLTLDDVAPMIAADQIRDVDLAEVHAKGVHPERVGVLRIARGDVARETLIETELREQPKRSCETLLSMQPRFHHGGESRHGWQLVVRRDRVWNGVVHGLTISRCGSLVG